MDAMVYKAICPLCRGDLHGFKPSSKALNQTIQDEIRKQVAPFLLKQQKDEAKEDRSKVRIRMVFGNEHQRVPYTGNICRCVGFFFVFLFFSFLALPSSFFPGPSVQIFADTHSHRCRVEQASNDAFVDRLSAGASHVIGPVRSITNLRMRGSSPESLIH